MAQAARRIAEPKPTYSGRLLLRMPPELHAQVARKAELEQVSLNQFITGAVADAVEQDGRPGLQPLTTSRVLTAALAFNLVVLTIAGTAAVALLVLVWRGSL
jgi:hypothetical protein